MKTKLITTLGCLLLLAGGAFGRNIIPISDGPSGGENLLPAPITPDAIDPNVSFSLTNASNGTSATYGVNDTFTLTLSGTWSGFTANGFSLWLETNTALAPHLMITGETYITFQGATDNGFPKAFSDTAGQTNSGFLTDKDTIANPQTGTVDSGDLGATGAGQAAGTYTLATITFQLSNAPVGTYSLETTTAGGKSSEISDTTFTRHAAAQDVYTITIVPEPATLSLLGLGGLGSLGLTLLRARRKS